MMRINLLPYRQEKRKAKRNQFYGLLGLVFVFAVLLVFAVYTVIDGYVDTQKARNDFIKREIAALDKEIDEIKQLKDQVESMVARKQIIESLQQNRSEAVLLLSELTRRVPEGVYLRSLKQDDARATMLGYAQSSARVSALMRSIEASQWLENPLLGEIKAVTVDNRRYNEFIMNTDIVRTLKQEAGKK